jgi:hypothetical protein
MDPLFALGLLSDIVQFVEFASKLVSKAHSLYKSVSDEEPLELATLSTSRLSLGSQAIPPPIQKFYKFPAEHFELTNLGKDCNRSHLECLRLRENLFDMFDRLEGQGSNKRWALDKAMSKAMRRELQADLRLQRRLDMIRERLDTIRTRLDLIRDLLDVQIHFLSPKVFQRLEDLEEQNRRLEASRSGDIRVAIKNIQAHFGEMERVAKGMHQDGTTQSLKELSVSAELAFRYSTEQRILDFLHFDGMEDGYASIRPAHHETFSWIFQSSALVGKSRPAPEFVEWMVSEDHLYWISGKAGSGKSTLMKYIYNHDLTRTNLRKWSEGSQLIIANFFCAATKAELPKPQEGLLRSLLYQILGQCPDLIPRAFRSQWIAYISHNLDFYPLDGYIFNIQELWDAFRSVSSYILENKIKICFFIDGLDECEGDPNDIIHLIVWFNSLPNIKTCVSSRPRNEFYGAFGQTGLRKLLMENFNRPDIEQYVRDTLEKHVDYQELQKRGNSDLDLVKDVVDAANGVFLLGVPCRTVSRRRSHQRR